MHKFTERTVRKLLGTGPADFFAAALERAGNEVVKANVALVVAI